MISDTFDFVNRASTLVLEVNDHILSYDIESLFTNIPTDETIDIILNKIFIKPDPEKIKTGKPGRPPNAPREEFEKFNGMTKIKLRKLLNT